MIKNNNYYANLCRQINFAKFKLRGIVAGLGYMEENSQVTPPVIQKELYKADKILHAVLNDWDEVQAKNRERIKKEMIK